MIDLIGNLAVNKIEKEMEMQNFVDELIEARINGNAITGISRDMTYQKMVKRIRKKDIQHYNMIYGNYKKLYGSKIEMIEQIKDFIINRKEKR